MCSTTIGADKLLIFIVRVTPTSTSLYIIAPGGGERERTSAGAVVKGSGGERTRNKLGFIARAGFDLAM